MTSETAACESPRCSARDLRLTLCPEGVRARKIVPDLGRGIEISCKVSHIYRTSHKFKSCSCRASVTSELLTWGAGNLSAFWAFARGCDRVMHLQFRAGELGVSLVQVRAKRFEDSRSMRQTEWGQGDTKLLFRGFEISGIL